MKNTNVQKLKLTYIPLCLLLLSSQTVAQPAQSNKTAQIKVQKASKEETKKSKQVKASKQTKSTKTKKSQVSATKQIDTSKTKNSQITATKQAEPSKKKKSQIQATKASSTEKTTQSSSPKAKQSSATTSEVPKQSDEHTDIKPSTMSKKEQPSDQTINRKIIRTRGVGRLHERDSAFAPRSGSWSIGVFNPLKIQINDDIGIETHPFVGLLIAPNLKIWQNLWSKNAMRLQGMYGFSTPSWSLQRNIPFGLAGYLSPSCQVSEAEANRVPESCQRPGFDFVPQLGTRLSGEQGQGIWSIEFDLAYGLMISENRPAPLDSYAPVEIAYAPTTQNYRTHVGMKYSHMLHPRLALNLGADLYITGQADAELMPEKEPLSFSSQLSFDWATGEHTSLTFGAIMWVSDQRAFELIEDNQGFVKKESVMSLDIFPTLDFLWHY